MDTIAETEDCRNDSIRYTHAKEARNKELISIYDRESRAFQYSAIVPMIVLQAIVIVLFIVKKIVACGSAQFWLITFSFVPIIGLFVAFVGR
jgi:flagellar biosynthesis/type III secretory pathway M-ring protein FliF/YscJ